MAPMLPAMPMYWPRPKMSEDAVATVPPTMPKATDLSAPPMDIFRLLPKELKP